MFSFFHRCVDYGRLVAKELLLKTLIHFFIGVPQNKQLHKKHKDHSSIMAQLERALPFTVGVF